MKNTTNYTINHATGVITITNKFAKAANVMNSPEYNIMVQLKKDFPQYKVQLKEIKKKSGKKSYKGLTLDVMKDFIARNDSDKVVLFEKVKAIAETKNGTYAIIKKWFLDNYKDMYESEIERLNVAEADAALKKELECISESLTDDDLTETEEVA